MNKDAMHIKVHTFPEAGEEALIQKEDNLFEAFVREPAQDGQANKRVIELIRSFYTNETGSENVRVRILSGARSPHKILHIDT